MSKRKFLNICSSISWISISLIVFGVLVTAAAAEISITATDVGDGQLRIGYEVTSGPYVPVGLDLTISLSDGATVNDVTDVLSVDLSFPVYLDYAFGDPFSCTIGAGHPLADPFWAGTAALPASELSLCLAAFSPYTSTGPGDLNGDGSVDLLDVRIFSSAWLEWVFDPNAPAGPDINWDGITDMFDFALLAGGQAVTPGTVVDLVTLQLHDGGAGYTEVTITEDFMRGGVVDDAGMNPEPPVE